MRPLNRRKFFVRSFRRKAVTGCLQLTAWKWTLDFVLRLVNGADWSKCGSQRLSPFGARPPEFERLPAPSYFDCTNAATAFISSVVMSLMMPCMTGASRRRAWIRVSWRCTYSACCPARRGKIPMPVAFAP